jgi:outer membrane protein insertion porin family
MLSFAYNDVAYTDIQEGYRYMIPSLHDRISQISFQVLRDTRDRLINTRDGGRIELTATVAGGMLGGSDDFYQVEARGSQFFPVFRFQNQVVSIIARVGVIDAYGRNKKEMVDPATGRSYSKGVNYNNKYFLGGPYSLRGFEYRDVGPKQDGTGYFMGGNSYGLLSIEYTFDIVDPVRFAIFYDAGFVNTRSYDFSPVGYNDNFGFGLRLFVAGSPLSLDFGIPLTGDKFNRKGNQFNFSFGTRF